MSLHEYLQADPECLNLAEGAIWTVAPVLPEPDPGPFLQKLDAWAFDLAGRMPLPWSLHKALDTLNHFLSDEIGLRGAQDTYDHPESAVLPRVVETRRGLPIALSILWIDVARRLGLDAVGIALPGHFITGLRLDLGALYFDPFNRFLRAQNWNDAFWAATHLVLLNPGDPLVYRDRAHVQVKRGDLQGALEDLLIAQSLAGTQDPDIRQWIERLRKG